MVNSLSVCIILTTLVGAGYCTCNSSHPNYCYRNQQYYDFSIFYETTQITYLETYYYKCGFLSWYTCTGYQISTLNFTISYGKTNVRNAIYYECCTDEENCTDFDLQYTYSPWSFGNYYGQVQSCFNGSWYFVTSDINSRAVICEHIGLDTYVQFLSGSPKNGLFLQFLCYGSEQDIRLCNYTTPITTGIDEYIQCSSSYEDCSCNGNGYCIGRDVCKCNSGWEGRHCDIALCPLCEHGQCTSPNSCSCDSGWTGSNCNQAVCSYGCAQGVCDFPDFCKCDSDFIGATCDTFQSNFTDNPEYVVNTIAAGEELKLSCSVIHDSNTHLEWVFSNNVTLIHLTQSDQIEISLYYDESRLFSNLTIHNINLSHTGKYACLDRATTYSNTSLVDVQYPSNIKVDPKVIIAPQSIFEQKFTCKGFGVPLPHLVWVKEDIFEDLDDENYTVTVTTESSSSGELFIISELIFIYYDNLTVGNYECLGFNNVSNHVGAVDTDIGVFYIEEPPTVISKSSLITKLVGETVNLSFSIYYGLPEAGNDNISLTATFIGEITPIGYTDNNHISNDSFSHTIELLDYDDEGLYELTICNRVQCISDTIQLVVDAIPIINQISGDIDVVSFAEVQLFCEASIGKPTPSVFWLFSEEIIGNIMTTSNNLTISINSINEGGNYTCVAQNKHAKNSSSLTVTVQDPPFFLEEPMDSTRIIGESVEFSCLVTGFPVPNIYWIKNGVALNNEMFSIAEEVNITERRSTLSVSKLSINDIGMYWCETNNTLIKAVEDSSLIALLDVLFPPSVDDHLADVTKIVNENITFSCAFTGNPLPDIIWKKDNEQLINPNNRITVNFINISIDVFLSTMIIENLTKEDEGNYTCTANNSVSEYIKTNDSSTAYLTIFVPPYFIEYPESVIMTPAGDSLALNCIARGFPLPNITWMRIEDNKITVLKEKEGQKSTEYTTLSVVFEEMDINDTGVYRCSAINLADLNMIETNVIVQFPANVSVFPETVIAPEPNKTDSFTCKASGIPLPTITWDRLDGDFDIENTSIVESSFVMDSGIQVALSTLIFNEFTNTTESIYECQGSNNVTDYVGVSTFAYGEFLLAAMPSIESPGENITALKGGSINFDFEITYAVPAVNVNDILWKFTSLSGSAVTLEDGAERLQFEDNMLNITIYNITDDDAGIYNITASNRAGTGFASIELIVEGEPEIDFISSDVSVVSPTEITLACIANGNPVPSLEWIFDNSSLSNKSHFINNYTLSVQSVKDSGKYTCLAENEHGYVSKSLVVSVQDPPFIIDNPTDMNGTAYDSITLNCIAYGYPVPEIEWLKDGIELFNETDSSSVNSSGYDEKYIIWNVNPSSDSYEITSYINISFLNYDDNGQYQCIAFNSLVTYIQDVSNSSAVDIQYPPEVVLNILSNITVNASDLVTFNCSVSGNPLPDILWYKRVDENLIDVTLLMDDRISIDIMKCLDYENCYHSNVTIVDVNKTDDGEYVCQGLNSVPEVTGMIRNSSTTNVTVQVRATVSPTSDDVSVSAVVGHDTYVVISFIIQDDFPAVKPNNIIWKKTNVSGTSYQIYQMQDKYMFSEDRRTLNVSDLQYSDRGSYTLIAQNEAGITEASTFLNLEVEPELLNETGSDISIEIPGNISSVIFNCSADGIPQPSLLWYKDGNLLLNVSRYLITYEQQSFGIRSSLISDIQQASSSLIVSRIKASDSGLYECRADNSAGETKIMNHYLNITDNSKLPCSLEPCGDYGECLDTQDGSFYCECRKEYTGRKCGNKIPPITSSPRITNIVLSVGTTDKKLIVPPTNATGIILSPFSLTCNSNGIPTPKTVWQLNNNETFAVIGQTLFFDELSFANRGFYRCNVTNSDSSVVSEPIQVNVKDIMQYRVRFNVTLLQLTSSDVAVFMIKNALSGSMYNQSQILSVELLPPLMNGRKKRNIIAVVTVIVTVVSNLEGNDSLAENLFEHMTERLKRKQPNINPFNELPLRFDGCRTENTLLPSHTGNSDLDFNITWPEINLGETVTLGCPCGGIDLQSSFLVAKRTCGRNYLEGAEWEEPYVSPCNFTDSVREICQLATKPAVDRVQSLDMLTDNTTDFQNTEVTISVAVLLSATSNITGNMNRIYEVIITKTEKLCHPLTIAYKWELNTHPLYPTYLKFSFYQTKLLYSMWQFGILFVYLTQNTETFLTVINNLVQPDADVLQQSQLTANTSARLLEGLETVTNELVNETSEDNIIIPLDSFVISIQKYDINSFNGTRIAIFNSGNNTNQIICTDFNERDECQTTDVPTAAITLPPDIFEYASNFTSNAIISVAYVNDALFLRRDNLHQEVATVILSTSIAGTDKVEGLENSFINLVFQKSEKQLLENGSDPICSFWNSSLDDNYGDWSSEGCHLVNESYHNLTDEHFFTCECDHLTSFSALLDVSYKNIEPQDDAIGTFLTIYTYIGCLISITCLILSILSHTMNKKLFKTEHGQLMINLSLSMIGVYLTFISAIHSIHHSVICILVAALLQYFFLVAFLVMAIEAVDLYKKTVLILKPKIRNFAIKVYIICWVLPIIIVAFCIAPDPKYYVNDSLCRARKIPFYIGTIVPFGIIYIFNWCMFVIIYASIMKNTRNTLYTSGRNTNPRLQQIKRRLRIAVVLSVVFGLGWGVGLPATQVQKNDILRYVFQICFNTLTAFQGVFLFLFHCVNSNEIRNEWKRWFTKIVKFNNKSSVYSSNTTNNEKSNKVKLYSSVNPTAERTMRCDSDISKSNFDRHSPIELSTGRGSIATGELTVFENKFTNTKL